MANQPIIRNEWDLPQVSYAPFVFPTSTGGAQVPRTVNGHSAAATNPRGMGAGNNDNCNHGVESVVGNENQESGMQGTAKNKKNCKKDLREVLNDANIGDMYNKFQTKGVTADVIWKLPDAIVNDSLELNDVEKFRYQNAKKEYGSGV